MAGGCQNSKVLPTVLGKELSMLHWF
jgi:hypothetical protein